VLFPTRPTRASTQIRVGSAYTSPESALAVATFFQDASRIDLLGNITLDEDTCERSMDAQCNVYLARSNTSRFRRVVSVVREILEKRSKRRLNQKRLRDEKGVEASCASAMLSFHGGRNFGMHAAACVDTFPL